MLYLPNICAPRVALCMHLERTEIKTTTWFFFLPFIAFVYNELTLSSHYQRGEDGQQGNKRCDYIPNGTNEIEEAKRGKSGTAGQ